MIWYCQNLHFPQILFFLLSDKHLPESPMRYGVMRVSSSLPSWLSNGKGGTCKQNIKIGFFPENRFSLTMLINSGKKTSCALVGNSLLSSTNLQFRSLQIRMHRDDLQAALGEGGWGWRRIKFIFVSLSWYFYICISWCFTSILYIFES